MDARLTARARRLLAPALLLAIICSAVLCLSPQVAMGKEYGVSRSDIRATVGTDGVVSVEEDRQYRFVGQSTYVYWDLSSQYGEGYEIAGVGEVGEDGSLSEFPEGMLGEPGTYAVTREQGRTLVRLHIDKSDTKATFRLSYRLSGVVARHSDVGEVYWRFVPGNLTEGQSVSNVTCTIALPVPAGVEMAYGDVDGANVMAWDHGSLDASVAPGRDGDVVYTFPHVNSEGSEYAEAVVVFPSAWLSDMRSDGWVALPGIVQQEGSWSYLADSVRTTTLVQLIGFIALFLVVTLVCYLIFRRYGRNHRARFHGEYWREAPSDDHPAIIGYVWSEGAVKPSLLETCILHLAAQGRVAVSRELLPEPLRTRRRAQTEVIAADFPNAAQIPDPIDRKTMEFLAFVAQGRPLLAAEDIRQSARQDPGGFRGAYNAWHAAVADVGGRTGYIERNQKTLGIAFGIVSFLMLCGAIGVLAFALAPGLAVPAVVLAGVVPIACTIGVFAMALFSGRRNREATEIQAKCQALNRWLRDFPKLDEDIPADVGTWKRLFVLASALGAPEAALGGMRRAIPDTLGNSGFQQAFGWCYDSRSRGGDVKLLGYNDLGSVLADVAASTGCAEAGGNANGMG